MFKECNDMNSYTLQGQKGLELTLYCDAIILCGKIGGVWEIRAVRSVYLPSSNPKFTPAETLQALGVSRLLGLLKIQYSWVAFCY